MRLSSIASSFLYVRFFKPQKKMTIFVDNVNFTLRVALTYVNTLGFWNNLFIGYDNRVFYCYTAFTFFYFNGTFTLAQTVDLILNIGDVVTMTAIATLLLTNFVIAAKFAQLLAKRTAVQKMVQECDDVLRSQTGLKRRKIVIDCDKETSRFMFIFYSSTIISVILWSLNTEPNGMPLRAWLPWDISTTPAYEITYALQLSILWISAIGNICIDFIMVSLAAQCKCRLQLLCDALEAVGDDMTATDQQIFSDAQENIVKTRLHSCIREHQSILTCARNLESCFSFPVLVQFAVASTTLCVILYQMVFEANTLMAAVGMFIYLNVIIQQVFYYCYYGNELLIQSLKVADSVYQFPWYQCSAPVRRSLLTVVVRARNAAYISGGGLFDLSLATFVSIVKCAYSFFTVLSRVAD